MVHERNTALLAENSSFEALLDTTCDRLRERQSHYSIQRIDEMDDELAALEKELDEIAGQNSGGPKAGTGRL